MTFNDNESELSKIFITRINSFSIVAKITVFSKSAQRTRNVFIRRKIVSSKLFKKQRDFFTSQVFQVSNNHSQFIKISINVNKRVDIKKIIL